MEMLRTFSPFSFSRDDARTLCSTKGEAWMVPPDLHLVNSGDARLCFGGVISRSDWTSSEFELSTCGCASVGVSVIRLIVVWVGMGEAIGEELTGGVPSLDKEEGGERDWDRRNSR